MQARARLNTVSDGPAHATPLAPSTSTRQPPRKRQPAATRRVMVGRVARRVVGLLAQGIFVGLIAVAVIIFVLPQVSAYATPQSYVYGDTETAVLIQWSEHDSQMDGIFQIATVDATAQVIRARYTGFAGRHDGAHVTITFRDAQGSVQTVEGTLGWRSLRLGIPQSGAEIAAVPLTPGDLADYDRAVQAIQRAHPGLEIQGN